MATANPLIEEIHQFRQEYAHRFNNDLKAICNNARSKQGVDGRQVISANPKFIQQINRYPQSDLPSES